MVTGSLCFMSLKRKKKVENVSVTLAAEASLSSCSSVSLIPANVFEFTEGAKQHLGSR